MNFRILLTSVAAATLASLSPELQAAPNPAADGKGVRPAGARAVDGPPARLLSPYVINVDSLLELRRPQLYDQAPGRIVELKQNFTGRLAGADAPTKEALDAAIKTCDLLIAALEERDKTKAQIAASATAKGSDDADSAQRWKDRSVELRKQITEAHRKIPSS